MGASDILVRVKVDPKNKSQVFIHAAIICIIDHGYAETTVRKIAKYAGVTPGLLIHYFDGKEDLIAETYRYLDSYLLNSYSESAGGEKTDAMEKLKCFFAARVESETLSPLLLKVWAAFWSLTLTRSDMKHIHQGVYQNSLGEMISMLENAFEESGKEMDSAEVRRIAIGILALFDGLWLEWSLNPTTFSASDALQIITEFVEARTSLQLS